MRGASAAPRDGAEEKEEGSSSATGERELEDQADAHSSLAPVPPVDMGSLPEGLRSWVNAMTRRMGNLTEEFQAYVDRAAAPLAPSGPGEKDSGGEERGTEPTEVASLSTEASSVGAKRTAESIGEEPPQQGPPPYPVDPGAVVEAHTNKRRMVNTREGKSEIVVVGSDGGKVSLLDELEGLFDDGLATGCVKIPLAFREIFILKKGSGLRAAIPYAESAMTADVAQVVAQRNKDKRPPPIYETWGVPNLSLIAKIWTEALIRSAEEYGNPASMLPSESLKGKMAAAVRRYVHGILEASLEFMDTTLNHWQPTPLCLSVFYQVLDKLALEALERSPVWHLKVQEVTINAAIRAMDVMRNAPLEASKVQPHQWKMCVIHGANLDHDARICPTAIPANSDRTVTPAHHMGMEGLKEACTLRRNYDLERYSWRALPARLGSTGTRESGGGSGGGGGGRFNAGYGPSMGLIQASASGFHGTPRHAGSSRNANDGFHQIRQAGNSYGGASGSRELGDKGRYPGQRHGKTGRKGSPQGYSDRNMRNGNGAPSDPLDGGKLR